MSKIAVQVRAFRGNLKSNTVRQFDTNVEVKATTRLVVKDA